MYLARSSAVTASGARALAAAAPTSALSGPVVGSIGSLLIVCVQKRPTIEPGLFFRRRWGRRWGRWGRHGLERAVFVLQLRNSCLAFFQRARQGLVPFALWPLEHDFSGRW